ncbi:MAG: alkaline phosphatase family protein, partial [Candidatus Marinimicrobia bacterium]|nr:alkaline phosphatase family protein [Candidatus Neomarinimicrobiota bacterium]
SWYVRELNKTVNCVEDSTAKPIGGFGKARSYNQTDATAIGDWMKKRNPESKVYTVAGKDRAAVFLGGKNADLAIYYDWAGSFMTSDYYAEELPFWLVEYNAKLDFATYRDSVWDHAAVPEFYEKYGTADYQDGENDIFESDPYSPTLPVSLSSRTLEEVNDYIGATPWFDKTVLELATLLVNKETLGKDNVTDYFGVGISMADRIGHNHGPHSHEVLDYFLRLDQYLMKFINELDKSIGLENVVFVMSSDHGVGPLPEYLRSIGIDSERLDRPAFKEKIKHIEKWSRNRIKFSGNGFYFPVDYDADQKVKTLAKIQLELENVNAIKKVMTREEILALEGNEPFYRRMRNMIHPTKSADVFIVMREYYSELFPLGATHGTPYDYDTHVPIVFSHKSFKSQKITRAVATVDIAPTIARLVGA